ncbi:hypothetical protein ACOME3_001906 [Neoechinorhynchus agilis]
MRITSTIRLLNPWNRQNEGSYMSLVSEIARREQSPYHETARNRRLAKRIRIQLSLIKKELVGLKDDLSQYNGDSIQTRKLKIRIDDNLREIRKLVLDSRNSPLACKVSKIASREYAIYQSFMLHKKFFSDFIQAEKRVKRLMKHTNNFFSFLMPSDSPERCLLELNEIKNLSKSMELNEGALKGLKIIDKLMNELMLIYQKDERKQKVAVDNKYETINC